MISNGKKMIHTLFLYPSKGFLLHQHWDAQAAAGHLINLGSQNLSSWSSHLEVLKLLILGQLTPPYTLCFIEIYHYPPTREYSFVS